MVTIVQCNCGAEYRRTEEKFLVPHTGDAICAVCGAALESWSESTHVPMYELIEHPDRKAGMTSVTGEIPASCPFRARHSDELIHN